jgi:hypothetical protein
MRIIGVLALILCAVSSLAQDSSYEMDRYARSLENHERRQAMLSRPPLTRDEQIAARSSSESFDYPGVLSFGVGLSEGLARIRSNGKVGYIGSNGKILIAAKFDEGGRFSEGLARVLIEGKWGYINKTGSLVIQPVFEWACTFSEGRALVKTGEKWGYINRKGKVVISPSFDEAWSFSEGLAAVQILKEKYKTGYIDRRGKWVLRPIYDGGTSFHEGVAIVDRDIGFKNGVVVESHAITRTGRRLFEHTSWFVSSYSEGLLDVANGVQQFGFLDRKGRLVIPYDFDYASSFSEGLALVRIDDKWVYINKKGNVVLRPRADCLGDFVSGRARCEQ